MGVGARAKGKKCNYDLHKKVRAKRFTRWHSRPRALFAEVLVIKKRLAD
jgi:hypothetical protein